MGFSFITGQETIVHADNASFDGTERAGALNTNGQLWIGSTALPHVVKNTLTAGSGISITNGSGSITIANTGSMVDLHTARYIVSAGGTTDGANYTTIATAYAAAVAAGAPQTVFIQPGTYTENITLTPGINLAAFDCDAQTPNVTIVGKLTMTAAGECTITGIRLQTNGDFAIAITGTAQSFINLFNCYLDATNNTFISITSTHGNVRAYYCRGNLGTTGIAYFAVTNTDFGVKFYFCDFRNTGTSTTASTLASGDAQFHYTQFFNAVTTSNAIIFQATFSDFMSANALTLNSTGTHTINNCFVNTGGATSAISVGAGAALLISNSVIQSNDTNAITGAGTITYGGLTFTGTSSTINTTTQVVLSAGPSSTFGSSNAGAANVLTVSNTSNTASSDAVLLGTVAGASGGDPYTRHTVSGVTSWATGLDNSDSDAYVISASSTPGTTNVMRATTTGEINYPLQPAFLAYQASAQTNATGAGTIYTLGSTTDLTEVFDQGGDFDPSTGTFTAPITGRYHFDAFVTFDALTVAMTLETNLIVTSNRSYLLHRMNPGTTLDSNASMSSLISTMADMDIGDVANVTVQISNGVGDTASVRGSATLLTYFSGLLAC